MSVSIYDVAKHANVSIATVSRVLNDFSGVKENKRLAVKQAIKELNYVPSELARSLAGNSSGMIGISFSFTALEGTYVLELLKGAVKYLDQTSYSLVLINDDNIHGDIKEPLFLNYIKKRRIDAIMLSLQLQNNNNPLIKKVIDSGFPIAYSGEPLVEKLNSGNVFSVYYQRADYLFSAMEYFFKKGHRKIGMFVFNETEQHRLYNLAVHQFEKKYGNELSLYIIDVQMGVSDNITDEVIKYATEIIDKNECSGVFTLSINMAKVLIKYFTSLGKSVPDDISVMGIQWIPNDQYNTNLSIDCISISVSKLGYYGMEMLVRHLKGEQNVPKATLLDYELCANGSVKDIN